jgi:hypothetical protein
LEKSYGSGLYQRVADAIENLNLAPYQVDMFRKEVVEPRKALLSQLSLFDDEKRQESLMEKLQRLGWDEKKIRNFLWDLGRQNAIVHIMRVLYLKRLESSVHALKTSLRRQRDFQEKFLQALEAGRLLNSAAYRKWLQMESVDELAELSRDVSEILQILPKLNLDEYDVELLKEKVKEDIEVLDGLLAELEELTPEQDDKLQTLKKLLAGDLKGKKVVVFSYFKDTARYIYRQLREDKDFQEQANLTVEKMSIGFGVSPKTEASSPTEWLILSSFSHNRSINLNNRSNASSGIKL